jgi:hypothetical protein
MGKKSHRVWPRKINNNNNNKDQQQIRAKGASAETPGIRARSGRKKCREPHLEGPWRWKSTRRKPSPNSGPTQESPIASNCT